MMPKDEVVEAVERLVVESVGVTTIALARTVPAVELSFPQWRALVVIGRGEGIRVGDIARRIGSTVPTASKLVRRLEHRGMVVAARDESDRRATLVRLTPEGDRIRGALIEHRRRLVRDALADTELSDDLTEGLAQIATALSAYE